VEWPAWAAAQRTLPYLGAIRRRSRVVPPQQAPPPDSAPLISSLTRTSPSPAVGVLRAKQRNRQAISLQKQDTRLVNQEPFQSLVNGAAVTLLRRAFAARLTAQPEKASVEHHRTMEQLFQNWEHEHGEDGMTKFIIDCPMDQPLELTLQDLFDQTLDILPLFDPWCRVELSKAESEALASKRRMCISTAGINQSQGQKEEKDIDENEEEKAKQEAGGVDEESS
jgi:hypothetical protein